MPKKQKPEVKPEVVKIDVRMENLKSLARQLPETSGVYLMKDLREKIIYVGKAKSLRNRVRTYFMDKHEKSAKTRFLVSQIQSLQTIDTKTEVEALLLEASLIKKHRPKYNIQLRDDKSFPYIRIDMAHPFPRFYLSRRVIKDGSIYFGPYLSGQAVFETIRFLNQTFMIRDCRDAFMKSRKRPCLTHQIGRCTAPCVDLITQDAYRRDIEAARLFLQGKSQKVVQELTKRMKEAANEERFEAASRYRDSLQSLERILEKNYKSISTSDFDQDAIGYYGDERGTTVEVLHIRKGRFFGSQPFFVAHLDLHTDPQEAREGLISFINQYYDENIIPDELLLPVDVGGDLKKLLEAVLKERKGERVQVRFPTDADGSKLLEKVERNARESFKNHVSKSEKKKQGLEEIQHQLHLPKLPRRIECYDISNFQGSESVASQVVFEDGVPHRDSYRRYKIKTVEGSNDFASMREVISRRLKHEEWPEPDLIVVDGGKGQLKMATEILKELGRQTIPVIGLAKARTQGTFQDQDVSATEERFFLPGRSNPITFSKNSEALHILVGIRDEAHRFAITYHRKLREASSLESELDQVIGLGEKRKKALLKKFESLEKIKQASVDELSTVPGFNRVLAERILLQLNEDAEIKDEVENEITES